MVPMFEGQGVTIYCANALDALRELPDRSVNVCVTSPPYWALRDYGTAQWEGGDPDCDHKRERNHPDPKNPDCGSANGGARPQRLGANCAKCGARRIDQQLGLEASPAEYIEKLVGVFREVRRVLRDDGTLWLNMGDSYAGSWGAQSRGKGEGASSTLKGGSSLSARQIGAAPARHPSHTGPYERKLSNRGLGTRVPNGLKPKDLVGIPWRLAFALQDDGWWLRSDIIWHKPNPMPESVTDRPTKAHEYLFLFAKSELYYYNARAIMEPASPETHARYSRGRSANHKWADGGPGNQSIARSFEHMRTPAGWHQGNRAEGSALRDRRFNPKAAIAPPNSRQQPRFAAAIADLVEDRNKRSVWTISTQGFTEAHFATFPEDLVRPCILAGCPPSGKRCDCDELIQSPVATSAEPTADPTLFTGRAGFNRRRKPGEGRRPISRHEQASYAAQLRDSPHRQEMEKLAGQAFRHYIRTDRAGARAIPPQLLDQWLDRGWLVKPDPCTHQPEPPGVVLDPFAGSGTTLKVARELGARAIGIELNPDYIRIARRRLAQEVLDFSGIGGDQPGDDLMAATDSAVGPTAAT